MCIYKKEVSSSRIDTASNTLEDFDDNLDANFEIATGKTDFRSDISTGTDNEARVDWIRETKDTLYNEDRLSQGLIHVFLYNHDSGGGFANWTVGIFNAEDDRPAHFTKYRNMLLSDIMHLRLLMWRLVTGHIRSNGTKTLSDTK